MRSQVRRTFAALYSAFLFPTLIAATGGFDCSKIKPDNSGESWDLSKLGGPRSVTSSHETPPSLHKTTFTIDICTNLKPDSSVEKGDQCPSGTRVCGIEHTIKDSDKSDEITKVIPIAGDLRDNGGGDLDAKATLLSASDSDPSSEKGIRIELNGGIYDGRSQKVIVKFICDPNLIEAETNFIPEDKDKGIVDKRSLDYRSDGATPNLKYIKYDPNPPDSGTAVLHLEWRTKYVCKSQSDDGAQRSHWGFFTWFLIIAFLAIASYLIFGSWLNYNRNGARGWDLLPHGDTIRDIPYLLKDWTRRVVNTVSGSGYRGGYSAV